MTRYEAIEQRIARNKKWASRFGPDSPIVVNEINPNTELLEYCLSALALPEDGKTVNAELYWLTQDFADTHARNLILHFCPRGDLTAHYEEHISIIAKLKRYLELREQSGEPMPYKVIREGDKVRFE